MRKPGRIRSPLLITNVIRLLWALVPKPRFKPKVSTAVCRALPPYAADCQCSQTCRKCCLLCLMTHS